MRHSLITLVVVFWGIGLVRAEVVSDDLPDLSVGTVGVETGLSAGIWGEKPDAVTIMEQMDVLSNMDMNETERTLFARILMTEAGGVSTLNEVGEPFLKARLKALVTQGLFQEVLTLTDRIPPDQQTSAVKYYRALAMFGLKQVKALCTDEMLENFGNDEAFMRVICADEKNDFSVDMIYDVYRESGQDTHPFLNAAGGVVYRDVESEMPEGKPSLFEWPIVARAYGVDVLNKKLSRGDLMILAAHETVPPEVREVAEERLKQGQEQQPDGGLLDRLGTWIEARIELEKNLSLTPEKKTGE